MIIMRILKLLFGGKKSRQRNNRQSRSLYQKPMLRHIVSALIAWSLCARTVAVLSTPYIFVGRIRTIARYVAAGCVMTVPANLVPNVMTNKK